MRPKDRRQKGVVNDGGSGRYTLACTQCDKTRISCGHRSRVKCSMVINLFNIPIGREHFFFHSILWFIIKPRSILKSLTRVMLVLSMFNDILCSNLLSQIIICFVFSLFTFIQPLIYFAPRLYFAQPFLDMGYELNGHNVVLFIKVVSSTLCRSHNIIYFSRRFNIIKT